MQYLQILSGKSRCCTKRAGEVVVTLQISRANFFVGGLGSANPKNIKIGEIWYQTHAQDIFVDSFSFMFLYEKTSPAGLKLVLDFVFNHCGKRANVVQEALADKESPYRNFFFLSPWEAGFISSDRQEHTVDGRNPVPVDR